MSAQWPTAVATDSNLYVAVNELQNNLSSGINNAVTTLPLNSTTSFPTVGCVLIDNEVIKYTGVVGATLTGCTRAFDGTTAASHSSGAVVSFAIVADHHNVLKDEIKAIETYLSNNLGLTAQPLATGHLALASNASGKIVETSTTDTELGYVHGVTSAIQTQLNLLAPKASPIFTGTIGTALGNSKVVSTDGSGNLSGLSGATYNAAGYIIGSTVAVQQVTDTSASTSTGVYASTTTSTSITPKATTHKIKISVTGTLSSSNSSGANVYFSIFRGSTDLSNGAGFGSIAGSTAFNPDDPSCAVYLDSPATTSSTTYTVKVKIIGSGTVTWNRSLGTAVILLEEIAF